MTTITIYSKKECHLCDIAKDELIAMQKGYQFSINEIDIEKDAAAFEKFKNLIPVVKVNDEIISMGHVNVKKLKDILNKMSQLQ